MRVIYLSWYRDPDGRGAEELLAAWPTLVDVPTALGRAGIEVVVVQAAAHDEIVRRDGVTFRFVGTGPVRRWPGRILRHIRSLSPDVIHAQGLAFAVQTGTATRLEPNLPMLVQDHGGLPPAAWRRGVLRWGLRRVAGVAFTARAQAEPYFKARILESGTPVFEVLESSSHFTPGDQTSARNATGLCGDPCMLWVGRLNSNKDPLTVVEAFHQALPHLPDPHLWCCYTDAHLLDPVKQRVAASADLTRRVHLMGDVAHPRVEQFCRAADFLVLGSHYEGSGYAALEALACGTTPLVTDIPSFRRITDGGRVGALSPPGNAAAMARAFVEWSRRDRRRLRAEARRHFEQNLSFERVAADLRTAYEAVSAK